MLTIVPPAAAAAAAAAAGEGPAAALLDLPSLLLQAGLPGSEQEEAETLRQVLEASMNSGGGRRGASEKAISLKPSG